SLAAGEPVTTVIGGRLANSAILFLAAALVSVPLSIALGTLFALKRGSALDRVGNTLTLTLAAIPEFVIAVGLIVLFASVVLRVLPAVSLVSPGQLVWGSPAKLVLPVATLTLAVAPYMIRMVRSSVTEVLASDYVEM